MLHANLSPANQRLTRASELSCRHRPAGDTQTDGSAYEEDLH